MKNKTEIFHPYTKINEIEHEEKSIDRLNEMIESAEMLIKKSEKTIKFLKGGKKLGKSRK